MPRQGLADPVGSELHEDRPQRADALRKRITIIPRDVGGESAEASRQIGQGSWTGDIVGRYQPARNWLGGLPRGMLDKAGRPQLGKREPTASYDHIVRASRVRP